MEKVIQSKFIGEDFLLQTSAAEALYHGHAANLPIIDYHNHLSPKDIAENRKFKNLTEIWLEGDHYKWRAMRSNGVDEKYCTGNADPKEKFQKWAETVPATMRNPLYHWTHLELKNYFGVDRLLNGSSASEIYDECSTLLQTEEFSVLGLLKKSKAEVLCTTDDPCDDLAYHKLMTKSKAIRMYPTFRPDKAYSLDDPALYVKYINRLADVSGVAIDSLSALCKALEKRVDFFDSMGCRASDHGLEVLPYSAVSAADAEGIFSKAMKGGMLTEDEKVSLRCIILTHLCRLYHAKGWAQQFHLGALRNSNSRMRKSLGVDIGFDSIGDFPQARSMSKFFDHLDSDKQLAKTIIYNLNPADNDLFATMIGNFNDGSLAGKMQWGSGWWFLDQKDGMEKQVNTLSNMGLLSRFVGMVTDSRSFLSFPRHEYFRRILCNLVGNDIEEGSLPADIALAGKMIEDVCYYNAKSYFGF